MRRRGASAAADEELRAQRVTARDRQDRANAGVLSALRPTLLVCRVATTPITCLTPCRLARPISNRFRAACPRSFFPRFSRFMEFFYFLTMEFELEARTWENQFIVTKGLETAERIIAIIL